jgi:hypothetical protein
MPLTIQQDGSVVGGQPNNVVAQWWNDYHDLLTGVMTDQDVTLATDLILKPLGTMPGSFTAAAQAGSALGIGQYLYAFTYVKQGQSGESQLGSGVNVTTTSGNQDVGISAIPIGPAGTIARNLYRTKVGGSTLYYVAQIANNTATTYVDSTPDSSLTTAAPVANTFGGTLTIKDFTGAMSGQIDSSGRYRSFASASLGDAFSWSGAAGSNVLSILGIYPSDAGGKHWQILYNGGDGHFQVQQATDGIDALDIDTTGAVYAHTDLHAGNNVYANSSFINNVQGNAGNWLTILDAPVSGNPTVNKEWRLVYDGSTGNLLFYNVTNGKLPLFLNGSNNYAYGLDGGILAQIRSAGGGASGVTIWVGTTDPGASAAEGDVWIKA